MPITLKDIAQKTGYSVTTISRALGGYSDVNEQTRQHILHTAEQMGYHPNLVARTLKSQRAHTIGIVTPATAASADSDFFSVLLRGVGYVAARHHYDILLSGQMDEADEMRVYRHLVGGKRVDGIVVARTIPDDPRIAYLKKSGLPFVVSGRSDAAQGDDFPYIDADNRLGLAMLVTHFIDYGHQHIGLILPPAKYMFTHQREEGYRDALREHGLNYSPSYVRHASAMDQAGGYEAAGELLAAHPNLTAIIGGTDLIALGVMQALNERGVAVGAGVAVGGFDDIPVAQYATPPLTTIRQPVFEIGKMLAGMLIKIINDESPAETQLLIQPELVVRNSSGEKRK